MNDEENSVKRDAIGRFLPGHKPPKSPGRPPGSKGVKARAAKLAGDRLEEMLGRAAQVIEAELEADNPSVAMWVVDRVRPAGKSDYLALDGPPPTSVDDLIVSARAVTAAAMSGDISLQHAKSLMELLARQGQFEALEDLQELRETLGQLEERANAPRLADRSHYPDWGRLREGEADAAE